jgi:hypothetical protein
MIGLTLTIILLGYFLNRYAMDQTSKAYETSAIQRNNFRNERNISNR